MKGGERYRFHWKESKACPISAGDPVDQDLRVWVMRMWFKGTFILWRGVIVTGLGTAWFDVYIQSDSIKVYISQHDFIV